MVFYFNIFQYNIYYYNMNIYEQYDDNNIEHVLNGPDYGQNYLGSKFTILAWNIEDSFEFEYNNQFNFNQIYIEPIIYID